MIRQITMTTTLSTTTAGYPLSRPGISRKFIPNHPVIKVSGKKMVDSTVRNCILLFWRASIWA